jgi:hypothetical protein
MIWVGHVACMGMRNSYKIFVRKLEGKRPLRKSWHRWEDNILTDFWEIGWVDVDWMHLAQDRDQWQVLGT